MDVLVAAILENLSEPKHLGVVKPLSANLMEPKIVEAHENATIACSGCTLLPMALMLVS